MGKLVRGDIVVINFPFSDLLGARRRPALVLADLDGNDVILCQITSRSRTDKYAVPLESEDFINGKLASESIITPIKMFTADRNLILYTACSIKNEKLDKVVNVLINIFNN